MKVGDPAGQQSHKQNWLAGEHMAYQFEFDRSNGILRCQFEGAVTDESLRECHQEARRYAAVTNAGVGILDFSNVTSFSVSSQLVRGLALLPPVMPGPGPRFIVAPSTHIYGMARMFQELRSLQQHGSDAPQEIQVVRSLDEAYTLLEVRELHFEPVNADATLRKGPDPVP